MKYILVEGNGDLAALTFELSGISIQDIYKEMLETKKRTVAKEIDNMDIWFTLVEFKEVDPKFEEFIKKTICDYDQLKDRNIYRVE